VLDVPLLIADVSDSAGKCSICSDADWAAEPLFEFGVAVGESEGSSVVMVEAGNVTPLRAGGCPRILAAAAAAAKGHKEESVVDGIGMLVDKDESLRGFTDF